MKKIGIALLVVMALSALSAISVSAQDGNGNNAAAKEEFMQARLKLIYAEFSLSQEQQVKFEQIYRSYRHDVQKAATHRAAKVKKESVTEETAHEYLCAKLMNQISTSAVKLKYVCQFETVLSSMQVEQLYRIDDRIAREAKKMLKE